MKGCFYETKRSYFEIKKLKTRHLLQSLAEFILRTMIAPVLFPADTLIGLALESPVAGYTFSGGDYDGIYRQDYAYIEGLGNLAHYLNRAFAKYEQ